MERRSALPVTTLRLICNTLPP